MTAVALGARLGAGRVGLQRRAALARHRGSRGGDGGRPAPAAASIAAPRAVVSTSAATAPAAPVTSARICRHSCERAPPATHTISRGSRPDARIASRMSRNAYAEPSSKARSRCARLCAGVSPYQTARASAFHSGRHRAHQARQPDGPSDAGRRLGGELVQQLVDVDALLALPSSSRPRWSRNQRYAPPETKPGFSSSHVSGSAWGCTRRAGSDRSGLGGDGAHRLGRSEDVADRSRLDHARRRASRPSRRRSRTPRSSTAGGRCRRRTRR